MSIYYLSTNTNYVGIQQRNTKFGVTCWLHNNSEVRFRVSVELRDAVMIGNKTNKNDWFYSYHVTAL